MCKYCLNKGYVKIKKRTTKRQKAQPYQPLSKVDMIEPLLLSYFSNININARHTCALLFFDYMAQIRQYKE